MLCAFCELPSTKPHELLFKDDKLYVVVPQGWDIDTHRLVIPRQHARNLSELTGAWDAVMLQAERQQARLGGDCIISINTGANSGRTVGHLHVWVVACSDDQPTTGMGTATMKQRLNELLTT